jgi:hypothetical protein
MNEGFILDKPDQIRAFAMLQIYFKLALEIEHPNGPKWRVSPAKIARQFLAEAGRPDPGRSKKSTFKAYEAYLKELGIK